MRYLLDTNVCIQYLNGRSEGIRQQLSQKTPEKIVLCSVVKAELFYGALKSSNPARNIERQLQFIGRFASLPFDDKTAEAYGQIRVQLEQHGTPIGPNDLMIAAIAVANDIILVTHNTREFGRIEYLKLEDWES
ncbi:type II toxin-antitoxin system VapC family toxin [bacterium]|nr:type II toxin-antitoxin system VapC family toxin [bacterium]MBU1614247.1 type II toxin-antitoxin system VapC family toxin [bacterium]